MAGEGNDGAGREAGSGRWRRLARGLRRMDWLDAARVTAYLRILAGLGIASLLLVLVGSRGGVDRNGFLLGTDFLSFWTTGRMLGLGLDPYDAAAHIAEQRRLYVQHAGYTAFFYPPSFLPFCRALGFMDYFPALAAWLVLTGAAWLTALRGWMRDAGVDRPLWLLAIAYPATAIVLTHGQTAFLVAALLGAGGRLAGRRPWLAGLCFGLATIKPQFGLAVALALLLTREWRTIAAALATATALAVLSGLLYGADLWSDWPGASARAQAVMEAGAAPFGKMISLFAGARLLGAPVAAAWAIQGAAIVALCVVIAMALRGRRWSGGVGALALAAAPLATPFALDYDLVLLAFPLVWLAGEGARTGWRDWERLAIALTFAVPALARSVALHFGVPLVPPVAALLLAVIARRLIATRPGADALNAALRGDLCRA